MADELCIPAMCVARWDRPSQEIPRMAKPIGYTIHLLRVSETAWDADDRIIGQTDLPMTQHGSDTVAEAIQAFHAVFPLTMILTSNEESSLWSAKLLHESSETKLRTIDELSNVSMGLWEGELESVLEERCPSAFTQWKDNPARITPPEGESFYDAQVRLISAIIKAISKAKGEHPSIGLVLRPWAWSLVRCWLNEQKISNIWSQLGEETQVESFELTKSQLDKFQERAKASA